MTPQTDTFVILCVSGRRQQCAWRSCAGIGRACARSRGLTIIIAVTRACARRVLLCWSRGLLIFGSPIKNKALFQHYVLSCQWLVCTSARSYMPSSALGVRIQYTYGCRWESQLDYDSSFISKRSSSNRSGSRATSASAVLDVAEMASITGSSSGSCVVKETANVVPGVLGMVGEQKAESCSVVTNASSFTFLICSSQTGQKEVTLTNR